MQDGAAGGLVDPAGLNADKAVLDDVDAADTVFAAELVEELKERKWRGLDAAIGLGLDGLTVFELQLEGRDLVRRVLRVFADREDVPLGLCPGIFEDARLVALVQQVSSVEKGFLSVTGTSILWASAKLSMSVRP